MIISYSSLAMVRTKLLYVWSHNFDRCVFDCQQIFLIIDNKDRLWAAMFLSAEATHLALTAPTVLVTI